MESKRYLIIGAGGQLGSQFQRTLERSEIVALDYPDYDLTNPAHDAQIVAARPEIIINCAAYTAVDKAEAELGRARALNAEGPKRLAALAKKLDALLVHVSTDYVFDGTSTAPYQETDPTKPINAYGQTKLEGDQAVMASGARFIIARTAWLCGGQGPNFILTMLKLGRERDELKVVTDQVGSPTFTKDLVMGIMALIEQNQTGLFNVVNAGSATRFELVKELFRLANLTTKLLPATSSEFPTPAARPHFSVLSTRKLEQYYQPRSWQVGLADYYQEITED